MREFYALVEMVQDSNNPPDVTLYEDEHSAMSALLDLVDEDGDPDLTPGNLWAIKQVTSDTRSYHKGYYKVWAVRTKGGYR